MFKIDKKEIVSKILKVCFTPLAKLSKTVDKGSWFFVKNFVMAMNMNNSQEFYKFLSMEKRCPKDLNPNPDIKDVAIFLQGPIQYQDDFTIETALRYKTLYPNVLVVVSTWDTEKESFFQKCDELGIAYLKNKLPESKYTLNYQLHSSKEAIEYIKEVRPKTKYVLKSRTDQRIYCDKFLENYHAMLEFYPVTGNAYDIEKRLVFANVEASTYKYYAYHLCDMVVYGHIRDMENMYNIPFSRDIIDRSYEYEFNHIVYKLRDIEHQNLTIKQVYDEIIEYDEYINMKVEYVAELYIIYEFLKKQATYEQDFKTSHLQRYWEFLKNYAVVVEKDALELYWPKYEREFVQFLPSQYFGQLTNLAWLRLMNEKIEDDNGQAD